MWPSMIVLIVSAANFRFPERFFDVGRGVTEDAGRWRLTLTNLGRTKPRGLDFDDTFEGGPVRNHPIAAAFLSCTADLSLRRY